MTKEQLERALEALERVGRWVRDSAGLRMSQSADGALDDLATILVALEPSAVERVLEMGRLVGVFPKNDINKAACVMTPDGMFFGPDPESAARKALEEVER